MARPQSETINPVLDSAEREIENSDKDRDSILSAYRSAAVCTGPQLTAQAAQATGGAKALLRAVMLQSEGDVAGAVAILRRQFSVREGIEQAAITDVLAPLLIMRHDVDDVPGLVDALRRNGWDASAHAISSLLCAMHGNRIDALRYSLLATRALVFESNAIVHCRVLQRLARSAYFLKDYEIAIDLALSGARVCIREGAWRIAGACYSIAASVHHNVTGQLDQADYFARLCREYATKSGDISLEQLALVNEFDLAVQFGDRERTMQLERLLGARVLPQQYAERFSLQVSRALVRGAENLVAMRTILQVLRDSPDRSRGQFALATALIALSFAADGDDIATRAHVVEAVNRLGRAKAGDAAYERRDRRLARATLAVACVLIGDDVRGERILDVGEARSGDGEQQVLGRVRSADWTSFPITLRGISLVFKAAFEYRNLNMPAFGLTRSELEVLRLLGEGYSAVRIARETERSVNTIYNHSRAILNKFDVSRVSEAVAVARRRGLLF